MNVNEFLAEAEENVDLILGNTDKLRNYVGGKPPPDLINETFRYAHTLKGISYTAGFSNLGSLSHSIEELLNAIRMGEIGITDDILNSISDSVDLLKLMLANVSENNSDSIKGIDERIYELKEVISSCKKLAEPGKLGKIEEIRTNVRKYLGDDILSSLTDYEIHRIGDSISEGKKLLLICVNFSFKDQDFDNKLRELVQSLNRKWGEVISTLPVPIQDGIEFQLLFSTSTPDSDIKKSILDAAVNLSSIKTLYTPKIEPAPSSIIKSVSKTVRVDIKRLERIMNIVGDVVLAKNTISKSLSDILKERAGLGVEISGNIRDMERRLLELQDAIMEARMIPIGDIFIRLERDIKSAARGIGKRVNVIQDGVDVEIDKIMAEELIESLMHIVRNAVGHGIETEEERKKLGKDVEGKIFLRARHLGSYIVIEVQDDGRGIDPKSVVERFSEVKKIMGDNPLFAKIDDKAFFDAEKGWNFDKVYEVLFLPGFSIKEQADEVSGRGVGLDVVKAKIESLGGKIDIESKVGTGTKFSLTLPVSLIIVQSIIFTWKEIRYAIPLGMVFKCSHSSDVKLKTLRGRLIVEYSGRPVPVVTIDNLLGKGDGDGSFTSNDFYIIIVGFGEKMLGIVSEGDIKKSEVVIKPVPDERLKTEGFAGVAELGDRKLVFVLDIARLIRTDLYG
mgnify:CR=1 FL=1